MKKHRLSVYLDKPILDALEAYAARRRQSLSLIAEAAISEFLSPDNMRANLERRLARVERQMDTLHRDQQISIEALMLFVWSWLAANPPQSDDMQRAVQASTTARYDQFVDTLGQRLAKQTTARSVEPRMGSRITYDD